MVSFAGSGAGDESITVSGTGGGTCTAPGPCTYSKANGATFTVEQTAGSDTGTWSGTGGCTGYSGIPCAITNMTGASTVIWTH